jgi:hypothetical protein
MKERRSDRAHPRKLHLMFILPWFIGAHSRTSEKSGRLSRIDCDNPWLTRLRMALSSTVDSNLPRAVGRARNGALIVQARRSVNTLSLCLIILLILTIVNLRGMREAGLLFMVLTCIFVGTLLAMIAIGIWAAIAADGHPRPVVAPPAATRAVQSAALWLLPFTTAGGGGGQGDFLLRQYRLDRAGSLPVGEYLVRGFSPPLGGSRRRISAERVCQSRPAAGLFRRHLLRGTKYEEER